MSNAESSAIQPTTNMSRFNPNSSKKINLRIDIAQRITSTMMIIIMNTMNEEVKNYYDT